jgi:hypothetical protein
MSSYPSHPTLPSATTCVLALRDYVELRRKAHESRLAGNIEYADNDEDC